MLVTSPSFEREVIGERNRAKVVRLPEEGQCEWVMGTARL